MATPPPTAPPPLPASVSKVHSVVLRDGAGNDMLFEVNWTYEGEDFKNINNWVAHMTLENTTVALPLTMFLLLLKEMVVIHDEAKRSGILG